MCLDQRGDDRGDALGHLWLGRVEVHPELRTLDPFHGGAIDQQWLRVFRQKNLRPDVASNQLFNNDATRYTRGNRVEAIFPLPQITLVRCWYRSVANPA